MKKKNERNKNKEIWPKNRYESTACTHFAAHSPLGVKSATLWSRFSSSLYLLPFLRSPPFSPSSSFTCSSSSTSCSGSCSCFCSSCSFHSSCSCFCCSCSFYSSCSCSYCNSCHCCCCSSSSFIHPPSSSLSSFVLLVTGRKQIQLLFQSTSIELGLQVLSEVWQLAASLAILIT